MPVRKPLLIALILVLGLFFAVQIGTQVSQIQAYKDQVSRQETVSTGGDRSTGHWQASDLLDMTHKAQEKFAVGAPDLTFNPQTGHTSLSLKGKTDQLLDFYQFFEKKAQVSTITDMEIKEGEDGSTLSVSFIW
ncbi:hypothetical protein ACKQTC_05840 [Peptococcus simiae]|uniref:Uncharacterized protein n=1 Tax=Peptococcus simiae TaxID=1643805 RepID=A0ABW9H0R3_9FIRM